MSGSITRRQAALTLAGSLALPLIAPSSAFAATDDPLPSWNDGSVKRAILDLVRTTTDASSASYVEPADRIATFDQDGTTWVEQPIYTQVVFALDQVVALAPQHPEWRSEEPFASVLAGDSAALTKFSNADLEKILLATHTGMPVEVFQSAAAAWIAKARDCRWKRPYTDLTYLPMLEVMRYLRASGYRTYIVTGGGQDFVRTYALRAYGVAAENVIGSALAMKFVDTGVAKPELLREGKVLLNNNFSGKAEDIYLFTGKRPQIAFGNSTGDREMLEYTGAGSGTRVMALVLHDDAQREYAYGPATGLPDSKIGTFTQALYDEAKAKNWFVISMKRDWNRVFAFE